MTTQPGIARYLELGLWLGLAALAYGLSFQFADEPGSYKWGPASWPRAIAVIMLLGALVNFATAGRNAGDRAEVAPLAPGQRLRRWLATAGIFVLPLVYVALLPFMGFYVATPLFLVGLLFYLGERRPVFLIGVPLVIFVLVNLVFTVLFFVALPTGTWPGFYDVSNWFLVTVRQEDGGAMEDFLLGASALFSDPTGIVIFFGGLLGGMLFGAIPGINMLTLGAVVLPFTAAMSPTHAIMLYSVIYCAGVFGGAITAILFNIPGSPENAPTALDGYPMTLKGEASKAIGAAVLCSAFGGICSAVVMMSATPLVAGWAVRAFGPPEIFALICFGLAVSAAVGASTLWKGILSVAFGLLIATIGTDPADGIPRYSFDSYYLLAGVHFIPMILGLFAVAEVFAQGSQRLMGSERKVRVSLDFPKLAEFLRLKFTVLRSVLIGFFAGILPGIGATLAAFLSYNEAARWSKSGQFGKGELGGVVASETANNAATGAAMIPLPALGLPGGALTAMMMGVFQIHGMEPGPLVFITSKELIWVVFAAMFFANCFILVLGYLQTKTVVHLLRVPFHLLAPAILLIATIGAYALRNLVVDIWVMYVAGIAGYFLRRSGYSVAGMVLGLILGKLGESSFTKSMQILNYDVFALFTRPIAALLLVAAFATLAWNIYSELKKPATAPAEQQA